MEERGNALLKVRFWIQERLSWTCRSEAGPLIVIHYTLHHSRRSMSRGEPSWKEMSTPCTTSS